MKGVEQEKLLGLARSFSEAASRGTDLESGLLAWPLSKEPLYDPKALQAFETRWTVDSSFHKLLLPHRFLSDEGPRQLYMSLKFVVSSGRYGNDRMYVMVQRHGFGQHPDKRSDRQRTDGFDVDERFSFLSDRAFKCVQSIPELNRFVTGKPGADSDQLRNTSIGTSRAHDGWCLLVHELSSVPWGNLDGFNGDYATHVIPGLFVESAAVLSRLAAATGHRTVEIGSGKHETPSPQRLRVTVDVETCIVTIDGRSEALNGSEPVKRRIAEFIALLLETPGEYQPRPHNLKTRTLENQPDSIRDLFESQQGAGTRIPRGKVFVDQEA